MTDTPEQQPGDVDAAQMTDFCAAIGELILWASLIDGQLTRALVAVLALPKHAMIEPVVAQLDPRPKSELLKKRAKIIGNAAWRNKIRNWVERAEKVNAKRNIVAHHGIQIVDGDIRLHSDQLGKIIDSLEVKGPVVSPGRGKDVTDIKAWIEDAKAAFEEGRTVLTNLERFRDRALHELRAGRLAG